MHKKKILHQPPAVRNEPVIDAVMTVLGFHTHAINKEVNKIINIVFL